MHTILQHVDDTRSAVCMYLLIISTKPVVHMHRKHMASSTVVGMVDGCGYDSQLKHTLLVMLVGCAKQFKAY